MTGEEWSELSKRLRSDDELRSRIMTAFMARGMTEEEAKTRYDRVTDMAEIAAIPPAQRTEDQQEQFERAQADPTFKQDQEDVRAAAQRRAAPVLERSEQPAAAVADDDLKRSDATKAARFE